MTRPRPELGCVEPSDELFLDVLLVDVGVEPGAVGFDVVPGTLGAFGAEELPVLGDGSGRPVGFPFVEDFGA